jgi:aminotransferase
LDSSGKPGRPGGAPGGSGAENRDDLAAHLAEADIYTTFRYYPLHRAFGISGDFPNADYVAETTLNLPIHPSLTDDDVGYICQAVRSYFK